MTLDPNAGVPPIAAATAAGLPHRPADDTETVYFEGSPRLRGEIGHFIVYFLIGLIIAAGCIYAGYRGYHAALFGLIVAVLIPLIPVLLVKRIRYRITNYRIDYERGLLGKKIDTLELWHVEDIQFSQSFLQRMLSVGSIVVLSHDDTTPRLELHAIPEPRPIFDSLKQRIIAVKRGRGVIKVDSGN